MNISVFGCGDQNVYATIYVSASAEVREVNGKWALLFDKSDKPDEDNSGMHILYR
jgi:hypothetical protein